MSNISDIRGEFVSQATTLINDTSVSIYSEGQTYTPRATETFVRLKVFPNETELTSIGSNHRDRMAGLARFDVIGPRIDGVSALETIADTLVNSFNRNPNPLTSGRLIVYTGWSEAVVEEATRLMIPVFFRWEFFKDIV